MAFADYEKVTNPAPVFDRENAPTRMSEIIRCAVDDVEALLARGFEFNWYSANFILPGHSLADVLKTCAACAAAAIAARIDDYATTGMVAFEFTPWRAPMMALSDLTLPGSRRAVKKAWEEWPEGFSRKPDFEVRITPANEDFPAFKRDMLALADRLEAEGS